MARYDRNDIGQLVADDGRKVSAIDLETNYPLLVALNDAAGEIESALLVSGHYSVDDLTALTGNSLSLLVRMNCDVAMRNLLNRRLGWNPEKAKAIREQADIQLEKLRKGENTFNIQAAIDAGEPVVDGPTTADLTQLNLWRDRTKNYFPPRFLPNNR